MLLLFNFLKISRMLFVPFTISPGWHFMHRFYFYEGVVFCYG